MNNPTDYVPTKIEQWVLGILTANRRSISAADLISRLERSGFEQLNEKSIVSILEELHAKQLIEADGDKWRALQKQRKVRSKCERCDNPSISGERFCKACRKVVKMELEMSGVLTPRQIGHVGDHRTTEQREVTRETKHGTGHG